MYLDIANAVNNKRYNLNMKEEIILINDISKSSDIFLNISRQCINHCIQLTEVKGLSWILNENSKLRTFLKINETLLNYEEVVECGNPIVLNDDFLKNDFSEIITERLITIFFQKSLKGEGLNDETILNLIKAGYALVLLQIAAKVIYEKNGFKIEDRQNEMSYENLFKMVKNMNANLTVAGQPIETSTKFIEASLSYLRKAVAIVYVISQKI